MIYCKRVYEAVSAADGKRAFVDRLWPRGMRKENLIMDVWAKDAHHPMTYASGIIRI